MKYILIQLVWVGVRACKIKCVSKITA